MDATLPTIIGLAGVLLVLLAYGLVTVGRLESRHPGYQWLNIIGTVGIAISLLEHWNLASFVAQVCWMIVGIAALIRNRGKA